MPTVFVTQQPMRKDPLTQQWVPSMNMNESRHYGDIKILMPSQSHFLDPADLVVQLKEALSQYDPEKDSLIPVGDPLITATAIGILARAHGQFTLLRWDNRVKRYSPITIIL